MTDLASLAIEIDSRDVKPAVAELDKLSASAKKTEGAVDSMGREWVRASSEAGKLRMGLTKATDSATDMARKAQDAAAKATGMGKASGLAGHHMQNLAFQIQDVAVSLAAGQRPMTVFMQQGSQIGMIAAQAGVGMGGMATAVGAMALNFAKAHPLLLAASVAAAGLAAVIGMVTAEINKNTDVTVTWSDTLQATFNVIRDSLESQVAAGFRAMGVDVGKVWDFVARATKTAMNFVLNAIMVVPELIAATYDKIGPAFGDAFYRAANLALEALDWLVQKSAAPLNALTQAINNAFGTEIPKVVLPSIGRLENRFSGAMGRLGAAMSRSLVGSMTQDRIGGWSGAVLDEAERIARSREIEEAGGKVGKAAGKSAGKSAGKAMADKMAEDFSARFPAILNEVMKWAETPIDLGDVGEKIKREFDYREKAQRELDEANRARALDTANDIADIIGGRIGQSISELANALDRFEGVMASIGSAIGGLNLNSAKLSGMAGLGSIVGGSGAGGLGGIAGGIAGEKLLGSLGSFAGPVGSIVGGLIGGIIGGLLKKTPKASATVSIIAGEAMDVAITGNKSRLKEIAGGMANSLIDGLADVAAQFGAELGNATVSVGMRKKSYVVDPTGAGRTKGAGVINFGKDEAAAMEFAIRDAISDGVFVGLSAGIERLLKGEGSLDKQLQKALSLQSVMTEAQNLGNPSGAALAELDKWRTAMIKIVTEAGEGMTEVEAVYANRRTAITEEAAKAVFDAARPRRELEIEIMRLSGKETEALAASRRLELDGMEASIRPLQERAWALQDEADKLAAFKTEREALNIQLWQAMGREDLLRQNALEKLDPLNRSIQEWIWRIEDGNKAAQEAAQAAAEAARATEELAAAQKAAADEMAAKARAIAQERYSLDTQYYQLIGDTVALRARELELLDPSNRARQQEIWAIQDAMAANDAAAKARAEAIKATQDAIRADIDQRNDLIQSYNSQASAIGGLIDRFSGLAASIREFKAGLFGGSGNLGYDAAKAEFQRTSRMAALGNESSLQSFTGSAQAFLSAARDNAGSLVDYQRAIGLVAGASDAAAKGADGVAQQAAQQLNILQAQAAELEALNAQSAAQIEALEKVSTVQANEVAPTLDDLLREQKAAREDSATTRKDQQAEALSMISALNVIASRIARWDRGDYAAVGNDSDTPLTATVSGSVAALITNTGAAEAVPVDTTP